MRGWGHWLGSAGSLSDTATIALVLATAVLFAVGGSPVDLAGTPIAPPEGGLLALPATIPCLEPTGREPALATFE